MEKAKQSATASQGGEMQSKQQPKMDSFVKTNMYSRGSSKWKELTDSVTYCIAKDMLPIRIVKKEGFKTLVKSLIHGTSFLLENTCPRKPFQICTVLRENQRNHKSAQQIFSQPQQIFGLAVPWSHTWAIHYTISLKTAAGSWKIIVWRHCICHKIIQEPT